MGVHTSINPVTPPAGRLRGLASFIEERVDIPLDMGDGNNCAHKFACIYFGFQEAAGNPQDELAWMLQIDKEDASSIWNSTNLGRDRIVTYLQLMAEQYEAIEPRPAA
ncbi:hypothetical protein EHM76_04380 [bacterium]|nr:MAG: hypothetical protein EHM76_04380 [bacterium]